MVQGARRTKVTRSSTTRRTQRTFEKEFYKITQTLTVTVTLDVTITGGTMTKQLVNPAVVQPGDHVLDKGHDLMVKYIQGPDYFGVYDFHGVNETGAEQIATAQDLITLIR
jgi:carbohydrate-binding DOMON domain-containing protein